MRATSLLILALSLLACRTEPEVDPGELDQDLDGVPAKDDCDDYDAGRFPGNEELCNSIDDDCNEVVDDGATDALSWYADADGDGWGDANSVVAACEQPLGYVSTDTDCDDADPAFHPGAPEVDCTDPADYNCDGSTGYADADGDGWAACEECDDSAASVNPDADEVCNEVDDDCNGLVDEEAVDAPTWYLDSDSDGFGNASIWLDQCEAPAGYVDDATDCDDSHAASHPGGEEVCDAHDNDCDGTVDESDASDAPTWYEDADGDLWGATTTATTQCDAPDSTWVTRSGDCDDAHAAASPTGTEICDELDNDCDGTIDEPDAVGAPTWYADTDSDGYGDATRSTPSCEQPSGYVSDDTDCDDTDADTWPGADEYCDGADDDCDGDIDEDDAVDAETWYVDLDEDGYGGTRTTTACELPSGYADSSDDCDDLHAASYPGGTEVCDDHDNDCDGSTDESDATDAETWYADADGDGFGDPDTTTTACDEPSGYTDDDSDCDDSDASTSPVGTEVCDGADNDCDGSVDEYAVDMDTWYYDGDGDGYGLSSSTTEACEAPSGYAAEAGDCDDADAAYNPGATAGCDGEDYDCDGYVDSDADEDGYADESCGGDDCDDSDASIFPEASGLCALGATCLDLYDAGYTSDDAYFIDPDGAGTGDDPFEVWCDQTTDGGGWTLVWKHSYREVGTVTSDMTFFSAVHTDCLDTSDGEWCNVADKLDIGTVEQRFTATHSGTTVYDFTGDLNASLDTDWTGGILANSVELVDYCTHSTSSIPEPEHGTHAYPGLTWDKANNGDYVSNCDTDRYGGSNTDCRWENCQLPSSISSSAYHAQMTAFLWVR